MSKPAPLIHWLVKLADGSFVGVDAEGMTYHVTGALILYANDQTVRAFAPGRWLEITAKETV